MLKGLDAIDWAKLRHAYGDASDLPALLESAASGDEDATDTLFGNIWHQGTVYSATPHAVPFIIQMIRCPNADHETLLFLLREIACNLSHLDVHAGPDDFSGPGLAEHPLELHDAKAAHQAVLNGVPELARALATASTASTASPKARAAAAYALSVCEARAADIIPVLNLSVASDPSPTVRSAALLALAKLKAPTATGVTRLEDASTLERVVAAVVRLVEQGPTAAIEHTLCVCGPESFEACDALGAIARHGSPAQFMLDGFGTRWQAQARVLAHWYVHREEPIGMEAGYYSSTLLETWRGSTSVMTAALIDASEDTSEHVRSVATTNLAMCAFEEPEAKAQLIHLAQRADPSPTNPA